MSFDTVDDALQAFAQGQFVIVADDESRENEGDLIIAAQHLTTEKMAFMVKHTSGFICVPIEGSRADALQLRMMVEEQDSTDRHGTAYTITVDAKEGTTTGISAHDRALTARTLADPQATPADFLRPGHVLPLRARPGGVLARRGHTEATIDLCRLARLHRAGAICEMIRADDGLMARTPYLLSFAKQHSLRIITIDALVRHIQSAMNDIHP